MKKILVFEHTEYNGTLEKKLYHFCVKQQFSLIKYLFACLSYSFLYFFRIISKKEYYEKRWRFLKDVRNIEDKINSFWKSQKRKFAHIVSESEIVWISEYPEILLRNLAKLQGVELIANAYDISTKTFLNYEDIYHLYEKLDHNEKAVIYDEYSSKLKKVKNTDFVNVSNHKAFDNVIKFWIYKSLYTIYTCLMLLIMGISLGLVSMYFGASYYIMPMFLSYFKVSYLAVLNIFPVIFCIFLLYFITNRIWASFLLTSIMTMVFTWINYFKLLLRNDPLLAVDLSLFSESMDMAGKYNIQLNWKINCVIISCIVGTIAAAFLAKGKIRSTKYRFIGIVVLMFLGVYSFNNIYMKDKFYTATENNSLINKWSSTGVYISKGFIYPFIYSIKLNVDMPPEGYNEKTAKERLYSYDYSNISDSKKVNVITIMMEAYNDFSKFNKLDFNIDVYGYLHQLEAESYSGQLVTNIFAGGTVNTERSFLTGFTSLFNFRSDTNSYVRYFKEQGYTVEGSHPSYDWFYNRKNINEYLGFENYYFFENYYSERANAQIAKDSILFPQIQKLYEANKGNRKPYFSFNVTYQNHGPYSSKKLNDVDYIKNKGYTEGEFNMLNNYLSGIYNTTQQLKTLIDYFKEQEEPVVVILFGDHNPWMGNNNSGYKMLDINFDLSTEQGFYNYYDTPYIIWGNNSAKITLGNDFKGEGPRIGPYFLMNQFFDLASYKGNEFMKSSNDLKSVVDVVHTKNRYKEAGVLSSKLSSQAEQKLTDFLQVQYYWIKNFRSNR